MLSTSIRWKQISRLEPSTRTVESDSGVSPSAASQSDLHLPVGAHSEAITALFDSDEYRALLPDRDLGFSNIEILATEELG